MENSTKTKEQLLREVSELKTKIADLEKSETERLSAEQAGKQATKALRESEENFRVIFEAAADGIIYVDKNIKLLDVNPAFKKITGIPKKDVVGKSGFDLAKKFISFKQLPGIIKLLKRLIHNKPIKPYELKFQDKILEISTTKALGSKKFVGIIHDITERKKAEEALKAANQQLEANNQQLAATEQQLRATNIELSASEKRFRKYFEQSLIGMTIASIEKEWLEVNDALCEMLGYSEEELRKMTWVELTHPDDLEADLSQFNRVLANEIDSYMLEKRFIHKDGHIVYTAISANTSRNMIDQSVEYFFTIVHDITERKKSEEALKESEEKFRTFVDTASDLMNIIDKDGKFTDVNESMIRTLGYSREDLIGKHITEILTKEALEKDFKPNWGKFLENGKINIETTFLTKNGTVIDCVLKTIAIYDKDDNYIGSRAVIHDITERKQTENELRKLKDELEIKVAEQMKELKEKVSYLERFHDATIDRELRMKEMRNEIEELKKK